MVEYDEEVVITADMLKAFDDEIRDSPRIGGWGPKPHGDR